MSLRSDAVQQLPPRPLASGLSILGRHNGASIAVWSLPSSIQAAGWSHLIQSSFDLHSHEPPNPPAPPKCRLSDPSREFLLNGLTNRRLVRSDGSIIPVRNDGDSIISWDHTFNDLREWQTVSRSAAGPRFTARVFHSRPGLNALSVPTILSDRRSTRIYLATSVDVTEAG